MSLISFVVLLVMLGRFGVIVICLVSLRTWFLSTVAFFNFLRVGSVMGRIVLFLVADSVLSSSFSQVCWARSEKSKSRDIRSAAVSSMYVSRSSFSVSKGAVG